MTSGEVLFILAFIVLPTAVLVSSVWAVIFVRRSPDRVIAARAEQMVPDATITSRSAEDTVLIAAVERPAQDRRATTVDTGDAGSDNSTLDGGGDEEAVGQDDLVAVEVAEDDDPDRLGPDIPDTGIPEPVRPVADLLESAVVQTTEDLDDVVAKIAALGPEPVKPPTDATNDEPAEPAPPNDSEEHEELSTMHETSELPVIKPLDPTGQAPIEEREPAGSENEPPSKGRRKRTARLRPSEQDGARQRGRNRDAQRQVPQLGRSSRRSDEATQDSPADPKSDPGETAPGDR